MQTKLLVLAVLLLSTCSVFAGPVEPPQGKQVSQEQLCSHGDHAALPSAEITKPSGDPVKLKLGSSSLRTSYTFAQLNALSYPDLIDLIVTLQWYDIEGLFEFSTSSHEFFIDQDRVLALIEALEVRGTQFTTDNDFGCDVLVEVIRSGYYLGFYYNELSYLNTEEFKSNCWPAMMSMANNPNFGLGTETQDTIVGSLGALMGIGSASVEAVNKLAPVFAAFNANADAYLLDWDKRFTIYRAGGGVDYALVSSYLYHHPDPTVSPYYDQIGEFLTHVGELALHGTLHEDFTWLINNAVWWGGRLGQFAPPPTGVQLMTDVIDLYGHWPMPSLQAVDLIDWIYGGVDANGVAVDMDQVRAELHEILLPATYAFDDETIIFNCGGDVDPQKVKRLYWAVKEVRSQFHRSIGSDTVLEAGNADDVLMAIVFNSPADYEYNRFLNNLSTNNGGIYIESWGTFFTYERTPQESYYTLEDLFRHEYTHFLQGRFLEPGLWGQHPIYDHNRLNWFDEGQAEFFAGSSRDDGVQTRKTMVEGIASNVVDRMTLAEVLDATYSSGWEFYTYSFAFFDFMYNNRLDILNNLYSYVKAGDGDGFDVYIDLLQADIALETAYQAHMDYLVANVNSFTNPETDDAYLAEVPAWDPDQIYTDIAGISSIADTEVAVFTSPEHNLFALRGAFTGTAAGTPEADWVAMDLQLDGFLDQIDDMAWPGYLTVTGYFTDYRINNTGEYEFDLVFQGLLGTSTTSAGSDLPISLARVRNHPNPFNPMTVISYDLSRPTSVRVMIYDLSGRLVREIAPGRQEVGFQSCTWDGASNDGRAVSSGIYMFRVQAGD